jgi:transaldolase
VDHPHGTVASSSKRREPNLTANPIDGVKVFADGADRDGILELRKNPIIQGFTTNPTLMRAAGVDDYESFALDVLQLVPDLPISFEVFSDDVQEMEQQALKIASWADNVYVKVPVTNTRGESTGVLQRRLADRGVKINVTALMTVCQVEETVTSLVSGVPAYVSLFAGRVADTGRDPIPIMIDALAALEPYPHVELIWASPRELLNVVQAAQIGCDIITVTHDLLKKLPTIGRDLDEFSLDTVRMFRRDAEQAGYSL